MWVCVRLLAPFLFNHSVMYSARTLSTTALHNDQSLRDAKAWLQPAVIIIITFEVITIPQPHPHHTSYSPFVVLVLSPFLCDTPTHTYSHGPIRRASSVECFWMWGEHLKEESDNEHMTNYFSPYSSPLDCSLVSVRRQPLLFPHFHNYIRVRRSRTHSDLARRR